MFNQNQSGDGTSSLVTVCALMANVIIVRSMWQYDVVHFGNPVTILAMPYKKLDLDKYIVLIISMTFRCHFPNCSVGNRTCWNTIIFSPCCMDDSMQQRRCIHWLYCGLRWQSSSESKYTGPDLCSYKWRLYRKDIWKVKANGFMIVHSPPARWGSLDFNEGATPFLSFPPSFTQPSLPSSFTVEWAPDTISPAMLWGTPGSEWKNARQDVRIDARQNATVGITIVHTLGQVTQYWCLLHSVGRVHMYAGKIQWFKRRLHSFWWGYHDLILLL